MLNKYRNSVTSVTIHESSGFSSRSQRKITLALFPVIVYNACDMPVCWNGRRGGLKIRCQRWRVGSSPTTGTKEGLIPKGSGPLSHVRYQQGKTRSFSETALREDRSSQLSS